MADPAPPRQVYSVSELAEMLRQLLEHNLPSLWVQGEISNFRNPTGHWYFTLKDERAQVRCAMFRSANFHVRPAPRDGDLVLVRGTLSYYTARGDLQIVAEHLEPAGSGALLRAFEELKARLGAEGLFEAARKRPLPSAPRRIGLITSPTGAAIHDVLSTLRRRYPLAAVDVFPVPVQGPTAPPAIVEALRALPQLAPVDVVLLVRGGGSIEDLWAFNDERVARAIRACAVPVVVGVGHETDTTIADFAADLRAPTPTGAAEMVSPDALEWRARIGALGERLSGHAQRLQRERAELLHRLDARLEHLHPGRRLQQQLQRLDELQERLVHCRTRRSGEVRQTLAFLEQRLQGLGPSLRIAALRERLAQRHTDLQARLAVRLQHWQAGLGQHEAVLRSLNPRAVLERGYAIARDGQGRIVRDAQGLQAGERLQLQFAKGRASTRVEDIESGN